MWLLADGVNDPALAGIFVADWSLAWVNIGTDLFAIALSRLLPWAVVEKVLWVLVFLGPPAGAAMLHRAVFGRWHWWQLGIGMLAWGENAVTGLIGFQVAMGTALFAAALDPALARRGHRAAFIGRLLLTSALMVIHPLGAFFYSVLVAAMCIGCEWSGLRLVLARLLRAALAIGTPVVLLFLVAPHPPGMLDPSRALIIWQNRPSGWLFVLLSPILTYAPKIDVAFAAPLVIVVILAAVQRQLRTHAGLLLAGLALAVLGLLSPNAIAIQDARAHCPSSSPGTTPSTITPASAC